MDEDHVLLPIVSVWIKSRGEVRGKGKGGAREDGPVRKVRHHGMNILPHFPSVKNGAVIACESTIESDLCAILELTPWATRYRPQPFTIVAAFEDGSHHEYTPDMDVSGTIDDASVALLVECKPAALVEGLDVRRQVAIGRAWCATSGHQFLLVTEEQLRAGSFLANARILYRYARQVVPVALLRAIGDIVRAHPAGIPFGVLAAQLAVIAPAAPAPSAPAPTTPRGALYALLCRHALATDLSAPLTDDSPILLPEAGQARAAAGPLALN